MELLRRLEALGCRVRLQGTDLAITAPRGAITVALREEIGHAKADLVACLAAMAGPVRGAAQSPAALGPVQRRMWMLHQLDGSASGLNLAGAWRLSGHLDRQAFEHALREVVRRHDVLRSCIRLRDGEPFQVLTAVPDPLLRTEDLSTLAEHAREEALMSLIHGARDEPFDLASAPLFRALLVRLAPQEHVFAFVPHHVIWDGWCWDVLHHELDELYTAFAAGKPSPLPELPFQYADFALWHRMRMEGPEADRQLRFWRSALDAGLEPLRFPGGPEDDRRGLVLPDATERRVLEFDRDVLARLAAVAREEGATLFMALLAAWGVWLARAAGQRSFGVGVPIQDRIHPGTEQLLGVMVNTMVVPIRIDEADSFRNVLLGVRDHSLGAYDNQDLPYERLVRELADVLPDRAALFRTLFSYQDVRDRPRAFGDLRLSQLHVDGGVGDTDVGCGFMVTADRTVALLDFRRAIFDPATASRLSAGFQELVRDASLHPDRAALRLSVVAADSRARSVSHLFGGRDRAGDGLRDRAPLTPHQEGVWFIDELAPGTSVHHLAERVRIRGPVASAALASAWERLVARHDALRLAAPAARGYPELRADGRHAALETLAAPDAIQGALLLDARLTAPFDPATGPLCRLTLVELGHDEALLQLVCHGLVADERSVAALLRELGILYGGDPLPPALSFFTIAEAERRRSGTPEAREGLDWWLSTLAEQVPPLALPTDHARNPALVRPAGSVPVPLDDGDLAELPGLARRVEVCEESILLAAWSLALSRASGGRAFRLGLVLPSPVEGVAAAVGPFQSTVLLTVQPGEASSFATLCRQVTACLDQARAHSDVPFERLVAEANPTRSIGSNPLYQALVILTEHRREGISLAGTDAELLPVARHAIHDDVSLLLGRGPAGWRARLDYASDLFTREAAQRWAELFAHALRCGVSDPDASLSTALAMPEAQRRWLEQVGSGAVRSVPESVVHVLARIVPDSQDSAAVVGGDGALTFGELWARSGTLAGALLAEGVGRGDTVGVSCERSPAMVIALLGIWRAGAAYLPLDPEYPEERLSFMLADSGTALLVSDGRSDPPATQAPILQLTDDPVPGGAPALPTIGPNDLAYVIYTSGSTGRPKGVEVTHGNLANFIASMAREPGMDRSDVMVAVTSLSFDIAALELWLPLTLGARVEIADEEEIRDGEWLAERLDRSGATIMQATPSTWRMLLDAGWEGRLRRALCGGEAFPRDLVAPLCARAADVWNMYGPTETTVWSTVHRVQEHGDGPIPIGHPIDNTRVCVVDGTGRLLPPGALGELVIGGLGVARGYRERPELTRERFVSDLLPDGGRFYRTGDLARWRHDGLLEHAGRLDQQVKVLGHRIELGEIEAALVELDGVRQAAARVFGAAANARLAAYVVAEAGVTPEPSDLRRALRSRLPAYMIPGLITAVDALPLTPNGKVDREALPDPVGAQVPARSDEAPAGRRGEALATVWSELLEVGSVRGGDNFFELGGHSLLAIRAVALLGDRFGLRVDPRTFFFMTLNQIAESAVPETAAASARN